MRKFAIPIFSLLLIVFGLSTPALAQNEKAYWGLEVGQMNYEESGTTMGFDYNADYDLNSFGTQLGVRLNDLAGVEARYAFSNTSEEEVLGTPVEIQVSRVLSGFLKLRTNNERFSPYALVGYSDVEVEACGTNCATSSSSEFSYGAGLQFPIGRSGNAFKIEYVFYGESTGDNATAELSGINAGILF